MMNLLVLFGSRATEHDVSIITGVQAMDNLDKNKYNIIPVYIDRAGRWFTGDALRRIEFYKSFNEYEVKECRITADTDGKPLLVRKRPGFLGREVLLSPIDCALMAFHGMYGEDGTVQGLMELYNIPYTSAGVLGSATGMDKIAMKLIYKGCGLPVLGMTWFERNDWQADREKILDRVEKEIGYPAFVKPANLGSSIGISKAKDRLSLAEAIDVATSFDRRILVEVGVDHPDEINCAAVGYGDDITVSLCEMPVSWEEFLTFDEKYMRGGGTKGAKGGKIGGGKLPTKGAAGGTKGGMQSLARKVPAPIPDEMTEKIRSMTAQIFRVMDLKGVVRVDYIINTATQEIFVNEVNTIPGSLAFYLFEPMGIPFAKLLDKMVESAFVAYKEKQASTFSYGSGILDKVAGGMGRSKLSGK